MRVHLHFYDESRWHLHDDTRIRGKGIKDNEPVPGKQLASDIQNLDAASHAAKFAKDLNGSWAWVRIMDDKVILCVDHHRSVPLFYAIDGQDVWVSDEAGWLYHQFADALPDELLASEYLVLGYVTGDQTITGKIRQVEAGTATEIAQQNGHHTGKSKKHRDDTEIQDSSVHSSGDSTGNSSGKSEGNPGVHIRQHRYFRYVHRYRSATKKQLLLDFDDIVLQTLKNTTDYADGRPIVLPLSGGYDSRLIAATLKRMKYPDVRCYTYGQQSSKEIGVSKSIAEKLDLPWTCVTYTKEKWRAWFHSAERRMYYRQASGLAGIPNIQELVVMGELKEKEWLPGNAVIVTGHHGGLMPGGRGVYDSYTYREHPEMNMDTVISHVMHYHYYLWNWSEKHDDLYPFFRDRITNTLAPEEDYPDSPSACESWDFHERQAKFIIHAGRLYEFMGYDWWMPWTDLDYLRFWLQVPLEFRHDKNLYTDYILSLPPHDISGYYPKSKILSIRDKIKNTPVFSISKKGYHTYMAWKRMKSVYDEHPLAWYGFINKTDFKGRYTGREHINSFQSLELLRVIFENGFLSVDDVLARAVSSLEALSGPATGRSEMNSG